MRYAVVFVHGFLGFSRRWILGFSIDYFRGLRRAFADYNLSLHFPALPPEGSVIQRARMLARYIDALPAAPVLLIGHSMGGLDCRYLIRHLDPQCRVRGLVTLGTPHRGSPLARWCLDSDGLVQRYIKRGGSPGLEELTVEACQHFNENCPDREDTVYISYAGYRTLNTQPVWLRPFGKIMTTQSGDNDGLVAVDSACWGDFRGVIAADHLELVGWSLALPIGNRPFAHIEFYRRILRELLAECETG